MFAHQFIVIYGVGERKRRRGVVPCLLADIVVGWLRIMSVGGIRQPGALRSLCSSVSAMQIVLAASSREALIP